MDPTISITGPRLGMGQACRDVLNDLPEWFGIPEANENYVKSVETMPTFIAQNEGQIIGFLSLLVHAPQSAELYVMGVSRAFHRQGVGRSLLETSEAYLRGIGVRFFQVKTLAALSNDRNYAKTRAFYEKQGFVPLEVFPELWDAHNPCLQMIKWLA